MCVCAYHCVQLSYTTLHRTDPIIFPLTLKTIIIAQLLSICGKGGTPDEFNPFSPMWMMCPSLSSMMLPLCRSLNCSRNVSRLYPAMLTMKFRRACQSNTPQFVTREIMQQHRTWKQYKYLKGRLNLVQWITKLQKANNNLLSNNAYINDIVGATIF